jgi:hypothetical protein
MKILTNFILKPLLIAAFGIITALAFGILPCYMFGGTEWCGAPKSGPPNFNTQFSIGFILASCLGTYFLYLRKRR